MCRVTTFIECISEKWLLNDVSNFLHLFFTTFVYYLLVQTYNFFSYNIDTMYPFKNPPSLTSFLWATLSEQKKLIELYMCITYDNSAAKDKSLIVNKTKLFTTDSIYVYPFFCAVFFFWCWNTSFLFYFSFSPWLLKHSIAIIYLSLNCNKMNLLI